MFTIILQNKLITERERKRELFLAIQKRGPNAFTLLIEALEETAHFNLVRLLTSTIDDNNSLNTNNDQQISNTLPDVPIRIHPYVLPSNNEAIKSSAIENQAQVDISTKPTSIKVKKSTQFYDMLNADENKYPMRSKKRGVYLIINNIQFINDVRYVNYIFFIHNYTFEYIVFQKLSIA